MANLTDHQFQYVEGQGRPGFPALLAQFQADSDAAAAQAGAELDLPYGAHPRQRFDFFPAQGEAQGVMLYLHAGYWQSRDKSLFRFLAPAFQAWGFHVALANYPLCPDVTLDELVAAVTPSVAAVAAHARQPDLAGFLAHIRSVIGLPEAARPSATRAGLGTPREIVDIAFKEGRTGPLAFCTVRHTIAAGAGRPPCWCRCWPVWRAC